MLVAEKQLVIHLQTQCQKTDIGLIMVWGGLQTAVPYRSIGARSESAKERQVGGKAHPRRREAANCSQRGVGEGVPPGEVGPRVKGGSENKAQPLQAGLRIKKLIFKLHREGAPRLIAPGCYPMDQFGFWDGEGDVDRGGLSLV